MISKAVALVVVVLVYWIGPVLFRLILSARHGIVKFWLNSCWLGLPINRLIEKPNETLRGTICQGQPRAMTGKPKQTSLENRDYVDS